MSYDIYLNDKATGEPLLLDSPHTITGGTYVLGGTAKCWLNITYNYYRLYALTIDKERGIRWLYGKTARETLPVLKQAVEDLGTDMEDDYWTPTPGNAGAALQGLIVFAEAFPDGVWDGD